MNQGQLAKAVGQRLGVDTSDGTTKDGAAVRSFLQIRHDQLYRAFLWKDSIIEMEMAINAPYTPTSNYLPTKARVVLPPIFQHVLGARLGWQSLDVQRQMLYYRADYSRFMRSGYTAEFMTLPSCVWEFDTAQTLSLVSAVAEPNPAICTLDELQNDGVSVVRSSVNPAVLPGTAAGTTDRVDSFIKPATMGQIILGEVSPDYANSPNLIPAGTNWPVFSIHPPQQTAIIPVTGFIIGQTYNFTAGIAVKAREALQGNGGYINEGDFVATQTTYNLIANFEFSGLPVTSVISGLVLSGYSSLPIVTLNTSDLSAPKCQRLQLVGKPTSANQQTHNLHILGKRVTPPFSADTDVPGVNGLDGVLFALAYYDFKQRDEAGGGADALSALTEAVGPRFLTDGKPGGFLGKLIEEEVVQAAYNARIVPDCGVGGPDGYWDLYPNKGNFY